MGWDRGKTYESDNVAIDRLVRQRVGQILEEMGLSSSTIGSDSGYTGGGHLGSGSGGSGGAASNDDVEFTTHHFYVKGTGTEDGIDTGHFIDGARVAFDIVKAGSPVEIIGGFVIVTINGVVYSGRAGGDYTVSGNTITFASAPPAGSSMWGQCLIQEAA